ncbi:hypothetical protein DYI42_19085 [Vannielia litorea]|nr:hypothetical protein [Vannielia litorea]
MAPKPEFTPQQCKDYAEGLVERWGRNADHQAHRAFQLDLISFKEWRMIMSEVRYLLHDGPKAYDPHKPRKLSPLERHDKEVALMRREWSMLIGNSFGAILSSIYREATGDREAALLVGRIANTITELGKFKPQKAPTSGQNSLTPNNEGRDTRPRYYDRSTP